MIDTATAKQLLQSSDVPLLRSSVKEYRDYLANEGGSIDGSLHLQLLKLLILLQSRILQLQTADSSTDKSDIASSYAGMAHFWLLMSDGEKCQGQLNKAFGCDADCLEALTLQSELSCSQARFDKAIENTNRVISILKNKGESTKGQQAEAYVKLSIIYEMMGNFEEAVAVLKTAIDECQGDITSEETQEQNLRIELYGRLGTIQEKLAHYDDAVKSLTVAVSALNKCYGPTHTKTQEMEYLLEMACSATKG
jgi:tetratricopeptide (TPR) repeat protein